MFPLMYKYLMLHEKVCIPGVGIFYKERQPAKLDFSNKLFQPPVHTIYFKEEPVQADKRFYTFASKEQGIDEVEAIRRFHDFAFRFKDSIHHNEETTLPGLGTLKRSEKGKLVFESEAIVAKYFPATPAERIVRKQAEHNLLVGDRSTTNTAMQEMLVDEVTVTKKTRWLIAAVILAVVAIAAIVVYYVQHGGLRL